MPSVPEGESWKFYYYAGSARIAMRLKNLYGEQVYYFFSDHLGSTNIMTDPNGNVMSETLYKAWGEIRYSSGSSPTDFSYTGQRSEVDDIGLMFYNARWYDPELGRFAQADSIVPDNGNPIAQDRFAYGANNPISNSDPTGHCFFTGIDTAICILIEMLATGALAGYGAQVVENMIEGTYGVDALTNIDTAQITNVAIFTPAIFIAPALIGEGMGLYYQQMGLWSDYPGLFAEGNAYLNSSQNYINSIFGSNSTQFSSTMSSNEIGKWGETQTGKHLPINIEKQKIINATGQTRIYDGYFIENADNYVEVKTSLTGVVYSSERIRNQIAFDNDFSSQIGISSPTWIFVNSHPSSPLANQLKINGIPWQTLDTQLYIR